ncbi:MULTISPECIES: tautomerase family protein [Cupriavidus]|uniref:Phenylpyruvate tautomerase PptA (4-oxalocrotonate tautomerase family) n=2 Tax=Cupriavidus TaxID=106589 RepID=A0A316EX95_9BURK|nr:MULTISPECIES: 4-oxalocrotonate tautomerase [Cupriavidus]NYI00162.1 4-oxalocrotonate tautomerase [Cupriavidus plantarum]PWK37344.1 phenylpyruvate tautomerase PptA (4-oxalocrotonate tautomerase family) [Cupriavidus plantarum]QET01698.1 4-oxalocrotonate tautomerase [Cupriavidus pauculus]REF01912.1 phenylpyruvate tautomerase PptA (4-oxalocrotonate tautomerase family) [Cupriavidus plantarum]RLK45236.1 phenylpyruvate tautomerase PptA (4-oxalocrotonate tautomerase family) [Cupriavidus plantarum]
MPIVAVQHLAGAFTREQQVEIMCDIVDAIVRQGGEGIRAATIVTVTEVADGLWSNGGQCLTLSEIERRRAARAASGGGGDAPAQSI